MDQTDYRIDPDTGMLDKTAFLERFQQFLSDGKAAKYSLLYCNIRNFRYYNLQFGREAGDDVLRFLASAIQKANPGDITGRFNNDHFVTVTANQNIEELIRGVKNEFEQKYKMSTMLFKVGALRLEGRTDASRCCELAKLACDSIRNTPDFYRVYDQGLDERAGNLVYILHNIRRALREHWIHVYYQPVVRTVSHTLCGMEALVRWIDPQRGLLSPAEFIPVLEENQQITELDLYVLDEVCKMIHQRAEQGLSIVPVSINLSRLDFTECDIIQEVENCVRKYKLARDYIHLEVTETMVMQDPELLKKKIRAFRGKGYEVWMDDFGSGYSSLNVLRNFELDEIKLDLMFMRTFDEKTRRLVRSIISMAKEMKLKTLAEGVETREQYEFLRNIGCEKVQGFYFSPPVPLEVLSEMYRNQTEKIETRGFRKYYASAGRVNFITDQAMGILDYDGEKFHQLYENEKYTNVWKKIGIENKDRRFELFNSSHSYSAKAARGALEKLDLGAEPVSLEFNIYGYFVNLRAKMLAMEQGHRLIYVDGLTIHKKDQTEEEDENYIYHVLFALYNEVFLIHLNDYHFEVIKAGVNQASISKEWRKHQWTLDPRKAAELYIQKEDHEEYIQFMNPERLREKLKKEDLATSTKMFRSLAANGAYEWRLHMIQLVPGTDLAVYSTQNVPTLKDQIVNKYQLRGKFLVSPETVQRQAWDSIRWSKVMNVFCKDMNHRFIWANTKFLETLGVRNLSDLVGKTAEELHWNIDDAVSREDEIKTLREGVPAVNRVRQFIVRGKVRSFLVSKEPIYENGTIVGLIGEFISIDNVVSSLPDETIVDEGDSVSRLMSSRGIYQLAENYQEDWEFRQVKYAAIFLDSDTFPRACQTYGYETAVNMLHDFGEKLLELCGSDVAAGRLYGGEFMMLIQYREKKEVENFQSRLELMCRGITMLAGYPETINPKIQIFYSENKESMKEAMWNFFGRTSEQQKQRKQDEGLIVPENGSNDRNTDAQLAYLDDIPVAYAIFQLIYDEPHTHVVNTRYVYVNKAYCTMSGYSRDMLINRCFLDLYPGSSVWFPYCQETLEQHRTVRDCFYSEEAKRWLAFTVGPTAGKDTVAFVFNDVDEFVRRTKRKTMTDNIILRISKILNNEEDFETGMNHALEELSQFIHPDRLYVLETDGRKASNTFEWCAPGVSSEIQSLQNLDYGEYLGGWEKYLKEDSCVVISDIEELKADDLMDYQNLKRQGIQRILAAPFYNGGKLIGYLGADNYEKNDFINTQSVLNAISYFIGTKIVNHRLMEDLKRLGHTDTLTNVYNRNAMIEKMDELEKQNVPVGLVYADVNSLKNINDTKGHKAGDLALRHSADILASHFGRENIYRAGGDEFVAILPEVSEQEFKTLYETLQAKSGEEETDQFAFGGFWCPDSSQIDKALRTVDKCMYEKKAEYYKRQGFDRRRITWKP